MHAKYRQIYFTLAENGYIWQIFLIYIDMYLLYISNIYLWKQNVKPIWKIGDNISNQGS